MGQTKKIFFSLIIFFLCEVFSFKNSTPIHFALFAPYSGGWNGGPQVVPAMEMAINEINNSTNLLPNHRIEFSVSDDECDARLALQLAVEVIAEYNISVIIGSGCSVASAPIALLGSVYSMPQISYASTSPDLSNKVEYPNFMRVVSSDLIQATAWYAIAVHYKWTQVATLNSQETLHAEMAAAFITLAEDNGITLLASESFPGSVNNQMVTQLQSIKEKAATIIFLAAYAIDAYTVFYLGNQLEIVGGQYLWIGNDAWTTENFWSSTGADITDQNIVLNAATGIIGTRPATATKNSTAEFTLKYEELTGWYEGNYSVYVDFAYDAIYVAAIMLDQIIEKENYTFPPNSSSSWNTFREYLTVKLVNDTYYNGITAGIVKMNADGDRLLPYQVANLLSDGTYTLVGYWDPLSVNSTYEETATTIWPSGTTITPSDSLAVTTVRIQRGLSIAFLVLAVILIFGTWISLIFLIKWRETSRIRSASFTFMVLILISALLGYSTVIILFVGATNGNTSFTCIAPHWFGHIAFFICFGCLFAKTFRIWQIFQASKDLRNGNLAAKLSDGVLLGFVATLLLIVVIFLIIFSSLGAPYPYLQPDSSDPTIQYDICQFGSDGWFIGIFITEFVFLLFGVFLSFKVRKVELLRYNESGPISLCIYVLVFLGFIFVPMAYFLDLTQDLSYLIECGGILLACTTVVVSIFLPKFKAIIQKKPDDSKNTTRSANPGSL